MKKSKSSSIKRALSLAVFCSAIFYSPLISAQTIDFSKMESLKPRNIGPAGMSGRITAIDVVRSSPEIIYAGSASVGVWKPESGGIAWEPIFDSELPLSIGALAISQKNPDVIWVGTGEGNPRNSLTGGYGVYKSIDAGKTWELMGLEKTRNIHRVIIHPDDPSTVYIGAIGSPWGDHEERGVYKTTDGGDTWEKILYVDQMTGVGDMVMDPSNPNKILVNMWQHRREPWFFTSGGPSSGLYMTLDGGKSWKSIPYNSYAINILDLHLVDHRGKEFYSIERWYTPVHSKSAWVHVIGKTTKGRWMCNTANNIYYERKTKAIPRKHIVNPVFIEHLMGFPLHWTKILMT